MLDQLIHHLASRHEFAIFTFEYQTMDYQDLNAAKLFVIKTQRPLHRHLRRYFDAKRYKQLTNAINQWHPDVVVLNMEIELAEWM